jgi:hypothetical protein
METIIRAPKSEFQNQYKNFNRHGFYPVDHVFFLIGFSQNLKKVLAKAGYRRSSLPRAKAHGNSC